MGNSGLGFVFAVTVLLYGAMVAFWYAFWGPVPDWQPGPAAELSPCPTEGRGDGWGRWALCLLAVCLATVASRYWWEVRLPLRPLEYREVWARE